MFTKCANNEIEKIDNIPVRLIEFIFLLLEELHESSYQNLNKKKYTAKEIYGLKLNLIPVR